MNDHTGLGVMLSRLSGNGKESFDAVKASIGLTIRTLAICDNTLTLTFTNDARLVIWDDGQSCCETRYMTTSDDLTSFIGETFQGIEIKDAPSESAAYGEHEVQFLDVKTSKGVFQVATHNEHNGFALRVRFVEGAVS